MNRIARHFIQTVAVSTCVLACTKDGASKEAGVDVFGKRPVPPGELAKIKPDMTQAEVKKHLPTAKPTPNHSGSPSLTIESGYSNLGYHVRFYSDKDAVASVDVEAPKSLGLYAKLEQAWGPATTDHMGKTWVDDEAGYEVSALDLGRNTRVSYHPYVPLDAAFFGSQPGLVGDLKKIRFGMTRDQVKQAVPGLEGPPKGGGSYIPYAGGPRGVTLSVSYSYEDDKVERMEMALPLTAVPRLIKAWGLPKPGKTRGTDEPMHCWEAADKAMRMEMPAEGDPAHVTFTPPDRGFCELVAVQP